MSRLRTIPGPSLDAVLVAEARWQEGKLIRVAFKLTCASTWNAIRPIARVHASCTHAASVRIRTGRDVQNACERKQRRCRQFQGAPPNWCQVQEYSNVNELDGVLVDLVIWRGPSFRRQRQVPASGIARATEPRRSRRVGESESFPQTQRRY